MSRLPFIPPSPSLSPPLSYFFPLRLAFARLPFLPSSPLSLFLFVTSPLCPPSPLPCCLLSVVAYLFTPEAENANYPRQKSVSRIVPFGDMRTGQGTVGRVESAGQ